VSLPDQAGAGQACRLALHRCKRETELVCYLAEGLLRIRVQQEQGQHLG